jgi:hypothetical protein
VLDSVLELQMVKISRAWGANQHSRPSPISGDVTRLYVTKAGTADSKLKLRVLLT